MKISIVIPAYQESRYIGRFLDNRAVGLELLNFKYYYQFFKRSEWELETLRHPKRALLYKNRTLSYGYLYERRLGL